jgi:serine/threonine-protein kinase
MGSVWAATHIITRKHVALKFLKSAAAGRPDVVRRFLREARAASAVNHPNVVQIHDIMQLEDGLPVMVMDLLVGETLNSKLAREGRIAVGDLARILVPVISAVGTAHALGIVHRDLKPDNIFLVALPDGRIEPKVLDFGIAKLTADEGDAAKTAGLTQTGSMLGTPYYMAPEQAFGEKGLDQRADVWAVGVLIYQCLSGQRPVSGENLGQLLRVLMSGDIVPLREAAPDVPEDLCNLVDRMMVLDREKRLPDLREALATLKRYTDAAGQTFGAPAAPIQHEDSHGGSHAGQGAPAPAVSGAAAAPPAATVGLPVATGAAAASAATGAAAAPATAAPAATGSATGVPAATGAPLSASTPPTDAPRPGRKGMFMVAGAAVLLAIAGGVALFAFPRQATDTVSPEETAAAVAEGATPIPSVDVTPAATTGTGATESPPEPGTTASANPTATPAQVASANAPAPLPGRQHPGRPNPAQASSAMPAAASASAPAEKKQLPGGVVGDVPF